MDDARVDYERDRGAIVVAMATIDGRTFAKCAFEVATSILGWLLCESRRCSRHGWWCAVGRRRVFVGLAGEGESEERAVVDMRRLKCGEDRDRIFCDILRKIEAGSSASKNWFLRNRLKIWIKFKLQ